METWIIYTRALMFIQFYVEDEDSSSCTRRCWLGIATEFALLLQQDWQFFRPESFSNTLLSHSPILLGSMSLVFECWTSDFDVEEFDHQQRIPIFSVTLCFPSLPIYLFGYISSFIGRWETIIPGSFFICVGSSWIQVYRSPQLTLPPQRNIEHEKYKKSMFLQVQSEEEGT